MLGDSRARVASTRSARLSRRRPALRRPRPLTKAKMSNLSVCSKLINRTSLKKHKDNIFCLFILQILPSTTGRRQWFLISLSRQACRSWWTSELQILHLTKVRCPNVHKHNIASPSSNFPQAVNVRSSGNSSQSWKANKTKPLSCGFSAFSPRSCVCEEQSVCD